jgi:hypothetical protein
MGGCGSILRALGVSQILVFVGLLTLQTGLQSVLQSVWPSASHSVPQPEFQSVLQAVLHLVLQSGLKSVLQPGVQSVCQSVLQSVGPSRYQRARRRRSGTPSAQPARSSNPCINSCTPIEISSPRISSSPLITSQPKLCSTLCHSAPIRRRCSQWTERARRGLLKPLGVTCAVSLDTIASLLCTHRGGRQDNLAGIRYGGHYYLLLLRGPVHLALAHYMRVTLSARPRCKVFDAWLVWLRISELARHLACTVDDLPRQLLCDQAFGPAFGRDAVLSYSVRGLAGDVHHVLVEGGVAAASDDWRPAERSTRQRRTRIYKTVLVLHDFLLVTIYVRS